MQSRLKVAPRAEETSSVRLVASPVLCVSIQLTPRDEGQRRRRTRTRAHVNMFVECMYSLRNIHGILFAYLVIEFRRVRKLRQVKLQICRRRRLQFALPPFVSMRPLDPISIVNRCRKADLRMTRMILHQCGSLNNYTQFQQRA